MRGDPFGRLERLAREVNIWEDYQEFQVFVDALQHKSEIVEDMYAKIYEVCAEFDKRCRAKWLTGRFPKTETDADRKILDWMFSNLLGVLATQVDEEGSNPRLVAALYLKIANVHGKWRLKHHERVTYSKMEAILSGVRPMRSFRNRSQIRGRLGSG